MPQCSKCHQEKPLTAFIKNLTHRSGHNSDCKACDITNIYKANFHAGLTVVPTEKRCPRCTVTKPSSEFRWLQRSKDGLDCYCRSCQITLSKQRYYRHSVRKHRDPLHIRFWRNVNCSAGPHACWEWEGVVDDNGYGQSKHAHRGKSIRAHRLAWEITFGIIPENLVVMHLCNNPRCCNVFAHLKLGTQKDNMQHCAQMERMPGPQPRNHQTIDQKTYRIYHKIQPGNPSKEERFWNKVSGRNTPNQCWIWTGSMSQGYGTIRWDGLVQKSHRIAYILHYGAIPEHCQICHHCDNRSCCNPLHLFAGTKDDNLRDMIQKDRHARKLSPDDVLFIYSSKGIITSSLLAKQYRVTRGAISSIWNKRTWKHLLPQEE